MRRCELDPKSGISVTTLAYDYPPDCKVPEHSHKVDQLIYAVTGIMEIQSGQTTWWIPPHFAVWIPAHVPHRIAMTGSVSMRTLYMRRERASRMPNRCEVRRVTPLLRELILESIRIGRFTYSNPLHRCLRNLIVNQLERSRPLAASVTMPADTRALGVARALAARPAESIATLCRSAGAGVRTVERLFLRETGVSIQTWRRQVRLMKAIQGIGSGVPVKQIAFELGYRQSSPFIEMFRRTVGATPRAWLTENGKI